MRDKKIGLDSAIAGWAWALALTLILIMWFTEDERWGDTGIFVTGIAAVATVRGFIVEHCSAVRNAFELGRDSAALRRLR